MGPFGGATVVQKGKRKMQVFENQALAFCRTRSRSPVIVVYWGPNWPNCVKMRDFLTYWHWMSVTDWVVGSYGQFAKNTQSYSMKRWPKVTNAKSLCEYEWYCAFPTSIRTCQESQQKYNIAIKKILKHAGVDRTVTWLNPTTGEPEPRPIYEVLSSHSARKAFAGNMYKNVKDPNLVCALTGHKEGSKAFNRYRMIDEETNRQTMSYLE